MKAAPDFPTLGIFGTGLSQHGRLITLASSQASCPKHGSSPIISGDSTLIIDGKPAARHGDKTACGATLIAGQQATIDNI